jgi:hypothetical protein
MLRRLASMPFVVVRVTIGSVIVLARLMTLERIVDELDEDTPGSSRDGRAS